MEAFYYQGEKDPIIEYFKTIENITREKDKKGFIGGLPVSLEKKNFTKLTSINANGGYNYSVTQKVDGTRVFMFIGPKNESGRSIFFIDRKNNFYELNNTVQRQGKTIVEKLPKFSGPKMLLDGELVFFDEQGRSYSNLEPGKIMGISFMAFDILYGPIEVESRLDLEGEIWSEKIIKIGSEGAMAGPKGGPMWNYFDRLSILNRLIVPNKELNDNRPPLTSIFKDITWFNIEMKPVYNMLDIKNFGMNIYRDDNQGGLQKDLVNKRKEYYGLLNSLIGKQKGVFVKTPLKLDGLIFTRWDAEYKMGTWNDQYKWKPSNEQTIDFRIIKQREGTTATLFIFDNIKKKEIHYEYKGLYANSIFTPEKYMSIVNKSIGEFSFSNGSFKLERIRGDKNKPNAIYTANSVMEIILNPVDINTLGLFLDENSVKNKNKMKMMMRSIPKEQLIQCSISNEQIFPIESISQQLESFKTGENLEFELRLGNIKSRGFDPNFSDERIDLLKQIMDRTKWEVDRSTLLDVYSKKRIRTRYIYSDDFKTFLKFESIIKNRISNETVDLEKIYPIDVRFSLSKEETVEDTISDGDSKLKERITYKNPNGLFVVDITSIRDVKFKDRKYEFTDDKSKINQFEIEIIKKETEIDDIISFLVFILRHL